MSTFRPCGQCRDWSKCVLTDSEKEWFAYNHVSRRFCPQHVFWVLKYEDILRGYGWPTAEEALGGMSKVTARQGGFVQVSEVLAELDGRLAKTRLKGEVLREQCKNREKVEYLGDNAKDALYYVIGDNPRGTSFTVWLAKRRKKVGV